MDFGLITFTIAAFEHAVALARGTVDIRQPEKQRVPSGDMVRAYTYARSIRTIVGQLRDRFDTIRWSVLARATARTFVDYAASAAVQFEEQARELLPVSPDLFEVRSLSGGWPAQWVLSMRVAQEPLEIIAGERPIERSTFQIIGETGETYLLVIPVVGECVLIYEALAGRTVAGGRHLSNAERMSAGLGAILPIILGYSVKLAARAVAPVLTVTRRAVILALDEMKVTRLLGTVRRGPWAVELAVGLRALPESSFVELRGLLAAGREGALSAAQLARLNYYFVRMQDVSRLAQWLRIVEVELGGTVSGLQKLKNVTFKAGEEQALMRLVQKSGDWVVALPEVLPTDYPGRTQVPGVTHPDAVWRQELIDLYVIKTPSIGNAMGEIGKKSQQASTVVVALLEDAQLARTDFQAALPDFWSNPRNLGISRIVILDAGDLLIYTRPDDWTLPLMAGLARIGLGDPKQLARIVEALQAEPPEPLRQ